MKFSELRLGFEALTGESVDNGILAIWLNEAQTDIASRYGPFAIITFDAEAKNDYTLPSNFLRMHTVLDAQNREYLSYDTTDYGTIIFADSGVYKCIYHKIPEKFTGTDDAQESELHELLHEPLYVYAAAMFYERESGGDQEESAMSSKLLLRYEAMVNRRIKALKMRKSEQREMYV